MNQQKANKSKPMLNKNSIQETKRKQIKEKALPDRYEETHQQRAPPSPLGEAESNRQTHKPSDQNKNNPNLRHA